MACVVTIQTGYSSSLLCFLSLLSAPGSYCPDSSTQLECPKRYFCRAASVAPQPCPFFSYCPPGTHVPVQVWVGIFLAVIMLTFLAIIRKGRVGIRHTLKVCLRAGACVEKDHQSRENEVHKPAPRVPAAIPSAKFSITIRDLVLQKGSNKILNGIDVKIKSGLVMIQGTSGCGQ